MIRFYLLLCMICLSQMLHAQDDLMKMMDEQSEEKNEPVIATFKTTRIINAHSIETVKGGVLDFRVAHRFGNVGESSGGGVHTLYGFDVSADIRIAFEYGVNDRLTLGFSRSKIKEALEGLVKYRLLRQSTNGKVPLSLTLFSNAAVTPQKDFSNLYPEFVHRFSYTFEAIIGRKFTPGLSLQLMPVWVHRNYVPDADDENDVLALGFGGRVKVSRSVALIGDYYYVLSDFRYRNTVNGDKYYQPLALGVEVETGGHVFSIMFTNSAGLIENDFLINTTDSWLKSGFKFSFNISRAFTIKKPAQ